MVALVRFQKQQLLCYGCYCRTRAAQSGASNSYQPLELQRTRLNPTMTASPTRAITLVATVKLSHEIASAAEQLHTKMPT